MPLYSTHVTVWFGCGGTRLGRDWDGWWAKLQWTDGNYSDGNGPVEGEIHTSYAQPTLQQAINRIVGYADRLGVCLYRDADNWCLCYSQDGDDRDYPPPEGWLDMLAAEAARRGWSSHSQNPTKEY